MARRSSIRKLPPELRAEIDRLLADGRYTIREITEHLRSMGAEVSKSAVHRYSQHFEEVAKDIRVAREMAAAIGRELEDVPEGDAGRLLVESLQVLIFRARAQMLESGDIDPGELQKLAMAARDLSTAFKSHVETEIRIRERAKAAKDAAREAEAAAHEQGLSTPTIEMIKARILGIAKR